MKQSFNHLLRNNLFILVGTLLLISCGRTRPLNHSAVQLNSVDQTPLDSDAGSISCQIEKPLSVELSSNGHLNDLAPSVGLDLIVGKASVEFTLVNLLFDAAVLDLRFDKMTQEITIVPKKAGHFSFGARLASNKNLKLHATCYTSIMVSQTSVVEGVLSPIVIPPMSIVAYVDGYSSESSPVLANGHQAQISYIATWARDCVIFQGTRLLGGSGDGFGTVTTKPLQNNGAAVLDIPFEVRCHHAQTSEIDSEFFILSVAPKSQLSLTVNGSKATSVSAGDSVNIQWAAKNVKSCKLKTAGNTEIVDPMGTKILIAEKSFEAVFECQEINAGSTKVIAKVNVIPVEPSVELTANGKTESITVRNREILKLKWSSKGASKCVLFKSHLSPLDSGTEGSYSLASKFGLTRYTVRCETQKGIISAVVTVWTW